MTSLRERAGLPIDWNETGDEIIFDPRLIVKETKSRLRGQLRPVVADPSACEPAEAIQYWMYNGISLPEHMETFTRSGIQYELTLLYPQRLGRERSKTLGHTHKRVTAGGQTTHPEICEVLAGQALFFFQTLNADTRSAPRCFVVAAGPGDQVIFPPNLHHLTINAGDDMLLFSDLISLRAQGDYSGLSSMRGAAYLYDDAWFFNDQYQNAASLQVYTAHDYPLHRWTSEAPLYELIWRSPDTLRWLNEPDAYAEMLTLPMMG